MSAALMLFLVRIYIHQILLKRQNGTWVDLLCCTIESKPKKTRQGRGQHTENTPLPLVIKGYSILKKDQQRAGQVNCWHCGTELIWGADHDIEDLNDGEESEYDFFSNFSCP